MMIAFKKFKHIKEGAMIIFCFANVGVCNDDHFTCRCFVNGLPIIGELRVVIRSF
jgi:hypothetical protein